jgi:hypothetical protein
MFENMIDAGNQQVLYQIRDDCGEYDVFLEMSNGSIALHPPLRVRMMIPNPVTSRQLGELRVITQLSGTLPGS